MHIRVPVGNPGGRLLGRPRHGWDNIKRILENYDVVWIDLFRIRTSGGPL
jgi:hypothetical protein